MDLLLIPFLAVCLWGVRYCRAGFREDYLSVETTNSLRGILALLVVLHHLYKEAEEGLFHLVISNVGGLCVVLFLFFSGYGLQKSFARKSGYVRTVIRRRIPSIAVPFLMLAVVYWAVYALIGRPYTLTQTLISLVDGSPIVRYGWYTECLLLLYLVFALAGTLLKNRPDAMGAGVLVLTLALVSAFLAAGFPPFWYYSIVAFPLGVFWAQWEQRLLPKLDRRYPLWLAGSLLGFCVCFAAALKTFATGFYWAADCLLVLFVVLVLRKWTFRNRALDFLGTLSFEIYSVHGGFMLLYRSGLCYIPSHLLWACAVLASTIPTAWLLHRLLKGK